MRTKQLVAGAAIASGLGVTFLGPGAGFVNASPPPAVSNQPGLSPLAPGGGGGGGGDGGGSSGGSSSGGGSGGGGSSGGSSFGGVDSGPWFLPSSPSGPSGPSMDIPGGPSGPPSDLGGPGGPGGPPNQGPPAGPAPNEGPGGPGGPPQDHGPGRPGGPPTDEGPGDRWPWHRSPYPPPPWQPPWWWWQVPDDPSEPGPSCTGALLPRNAPAPPPFQYQGQTVNPLFDTGSQQWGFWFSGKWIPLYQSGC